MVRQAGRADDGNVWPRCPAGIAPERVRLAGGDAVAAEGAFAAAEIDRREAAVAGDEDSGRAGRQAVVAACAAAAEFNLGQRPRRPDLGPHPRSTAEEGAAGGIDHALLRAFHLVDAFAQDLVDFRARFDLRQQGFPVGDGLALVAGIHRRGTGEK